MVTTVTKPLPDRGRGEVIGLEANARRTPDRLAAVLEPVRDRSLPRQALTYAQLDARSLALAGHFRGAGLAPGDTVALLSENRVEFLEACWAAHRAGLFYVPIATALTEHEARFVIEDSEARLLVSTGRYVDLAKAIAPPASANLLIDGTAPGFGAYEEAIAAADRLEDQHEGGPLLYSSGTTGRPKGIQPHLSDAAWGSDDSLAARLRQAYGMRASDVYLSPAPLYHAAPLLYCMASHRVGATVVVLDRFEARGALGAIERHCVTHSQWVPTMFQRMLELPLGERDRYDLSSHRVAIHGAAPCPVELKRRLMDWWGPIVWEYYSATERIGVTSIGPDEWLDRPGSVGRGIVGEPHVCDGDGKPLPPGDIGTIWFAGGPSFTYRNAPDQTAGTTDGRGWRTVHDLGWLDDDGYLYIVDRRSDLIITGGVNVYPREVEDVLLDHPDVADVAVVGVPDERFGRAVAAIVEPPPGRTAYANVLVAHCTDRLAAYKRPRHIEIVDQLPRTETGKLRRYELVDELARARSTPEPDHRTQGE